MSVALSSASTSVSQAPSTSVSRVVAAGVIGNVLEWYDFAIYGYFATSIGRQFFPHEDAVAQLLSAFGIFALGYMMRPVGGVLVGHIGDRYGRRAALTFSVAAMAIPTFLIGLLPGYAAIGLAAPIALTVLRMVQGLSVGGEYTSSMVFLVEHAPDERRGLLGALTSCGATGGILLGSAVGAGFAAAMSNEALEAWGWRIPFLLGLVIGIAGYFLRRHVQEVTPAKKRERAPLMETLRDHWRVVLSLATLSVFNAVPFYVSFVYLVSWLQTADGIAPARALEINSISMARDIADPDRHRDVVRPPGAQAALLAATVLGLVAAVPIFWLLHHPTYLAMQAGQLGPGADHRAFRGAATEPHGGGDATAGALHGGGARLQRHARHHRRPDAAGSDLAGRAHRRRPLAGIPDHGGRRGGDPAISADAGDLSAPVHWPCRRQDSLTKAELGAKS